MNFMVPLALIGWIPAVLLLFMLLTPVRAVIAAFLAAWLFLPMAGYALPGLPDYTKTSATCFGVLLATLLFDSGRLMQFRPSWADLPMLVWCLVPLPSALTAGYDLYEGATGVVAYVIMWGVPYVIGRVYFTSLATLREFAIGFFIGGLIYTPLCLFEIRMSPQLHNWVYGYHQHDWLQVFRGGGFRPTVFMQHGLAVGTFMCTAALIGFWLWRSRSPRAMLGVPMGALVAAVGGTAVLCKSTGATLLLLMGAGVLVASRWFKTRLLLLSLIAGPVIYIVLRTVGGWSGQELIDLAAMISEDRAGSVATRLTSETGTWDKVQPYLWFGTKRFTFVSSGLEEGELRVIPDGMWIIALGCNGIVGLAAFLGAILVPPALFTLRVRPTLWLHPLAAPAAALAVVLALYMVDFLFNAMVNPLFLLAAGGLVSTCAAAVVATGQRPEVATPARPALGTTTGVSA